MKPSAKTLFARACAAGDLAAVRAGLASGVKPGPVNPKGLTPLHLAAFTGGSPEVVRALVDAGADVHATITGVIWRFEAYVDAARVRRNVLRAADTPLHAVLATLRDPWNRASPVPAEIVRILLDAGADPNALGGSRMVPLRTVADVKTEHAAEVLRLLLAAGAECDADSLGGGPLFTAVYWGNGQAVEILLAAGADPCRAQDTDMGAEPGTTPLHVAAERADARVLESLLAEARDVDVRDSTGRTPLHAAALANAPERVRLLLAAGADPNACIDEPAEGWATPVDFAGRRGFADVVALLEASA